MVGDWLGLSVRFAMRLSVGSRVRVGLGGKFWFLGLVKGWVRVRSG